MSKKKNKPSCNWLKINNICGHDIIPMTCLCFIDCPAIPHSSKQDFHNDIERMRARIEKENMMDTKKCPSNEKISYRFDIAKRISEERKKKNDLLGIKCDISGHPYE